MSFCNAGLKHSLAYTGSHIHGKGSTSRTLSEPRKGGSIVNSVPRVVKLLIIIESRDSDWLQAGQPKGRGSSPGRGRIFPLPTSSTSPTQWVPGAISPEVKRLGCEADQSPPTSAEVKNAWIYTSIHSSFRLHGVVLN
jgi:hypothetical protein